MVSQSRSSSAFSGSPSCDANVETAVSGRKRRAASFERGGRIGGVGPAQDPADLLDRIRGKLGDVGEGALPDLSALAAGLADQNRGRRFAIRDDINEHVHLYIMIKLYYQYIKS